MKNKTSLMTFGILISAMIANAQVKGSFTDSRDGKTYKTVVIGTQTWMAENLAFKTSSGCWSYENKQVNVTTYGSLYDWETAKKVCPAGWHLPTDHEWFVLTKSIGEGVESKKMKSTTGWSDDDGRIRNGTNTTGFSGHPSNIMTR